MELYRIYKSDLKDCVKVARTVSAITGQSSLYHLVDFLYSVVRYGVGPKQYSEGGFYELRSFDRKKTYTRQRRDKLCREFNDKKYLHILKNKNEFNQYFKDYINRDWIWCETASVDQIEAFLNQNNRILVKPGNSTKGKGVHELEREGRAIRDIANSFFGTNTILEELLVQHPQMCFANKSVNTLRINTVLDSSGIVHVIRVSFRCGIGESIIDNYSAGGVLYPVNSKFGRIEGPGRTRSRGQTVFVHPGTDSFMVGREIVFFKEALEMVKSAAKSIPQVRFIGWDVAILENGPVLIEGNTRPGENLIESKGSEKGLYRKILSYL